MDNAKLQFRLNTLETDIFVRWDDIFKMKKLLTLLYAYGYNFVNGKNFDVSQSYGELKEEVEAEFYKWYHGNSKPILHIFYNRINGKNELQFTTDSVLRTHPQYKKINIYRYKG